MVRFALATVITGLGAVPSLAHPHLFIDTGVEVIFDGDGHATALRITWTYDEMYSMMIVEDRGLDADFDGVLTPDEQATLSGFDMQWDVGYPGDTYALLGETPIALSGPSGWTASYQGGKLISTHLRTLEAAVSPGSEALVVQAYDPSFYAAYRIINPAVLTGAAGCEAQVFEPDLGKADAILQAAMDEYTAMSDPEMGFPAVGAAYADEVRVTCAGRS